MVDKAKMTILDYMKKTPELAALLIMVYFFLNAQEKRDVLLRELTTEWKAILDRNTTEWKEAHLHLERIEAWTFGHPWIASEIKSPAGPVAPTFPPAPIPGGPQKAPRGPRRGNHGGGRGPRGDLRGPPRAGPRPRGGPRPGREG